MKLTWLEYFNSLKEKIYFLKESLVPMETIQKMIAIMMF